jgi:hypothetical protein
MFNLPGRGKMRPTTFCTVTLRGSTRRVRKPLFFARVRYVPMPATTFSVTERLDHWAASYRQAARDDVSVTGALETVLKAGCEEHELFWHLMMVATPSQRLTRGELRRFQRDLHVAANHLRRFGASQVVVSADPAGEWASAYHSVIRMIEIIEGAIGRVTKRRDDARNLAVTRLSEYVQKQTGRPHHDAVSALASAALGRPPDVSVAVRQMRIRTRRPRDGSVARR